MSAVADSVAWPLVATAAAVAVGGLRAGRRRSALNRALHEVRRPLQALALAGGPEIDGTVRLAAAALERLDREINGGVAPRPREAVDVHALLAGAVGRWQGRAARRNASLCLRDESRAVQIEGDAPALGQALDNLVLNAIDHGGPRILVEARSSRRWLRISVLDSGRGRRARPGSDPQAAALAAITGRRRHGHGLREVRRVVAAHAGRFSLRVQPHGSAAVIELPIELPIELGAPERVL
jgi:signal transduction histidine kinase